jgi:hypothetical protein
MKEHGKMTAYMDLESFPKTIKFIKVLNHIKYQDSFSKIKDMDTGRNLMKMETQFL